VPLDGRREGPERGSGERDRNGQVHLPLRRYPQLAGLAVVEVKVEDSHAKESLAKHQVRCIGTEVKDPERLIAAKVAGRYSMVMMAIVFMASLSSFVSQAMLPMLMLSSRLYSTRPSHVVCILADAVVPQAGDRGYLIYLGLSAQCTCVHVTVKVSISLILARPVLGFQRTVAKVLDSWPKDASG
jgi:hypothetical protein